MLDQRPVFENKDKSFNFLRASPASMPKRIARCAVMANGYWAAIREMYGPDGSYLLSMVGRHSCEGMAHCLPES